MLSRGSEEEKLQWVFSLYDTDGDGLVTRQEFTEIVSSIYDMMGKCTDPAVDERCVYDHISRVYEVRFIHTVVSTRNFTTFLS